MPLAIAALLVSLSLYPPQAPKPQRVSINQSTQVTDKAKPTQSSNAKSSSPSPAPVVAGEAQSKNNEQRTSEGDQGIRIQRQLEIATWVLVAIGIATAGFICWQAWETRKAARATQQAATAAQASVDLQRVAMDQWIDTEDWFANSSGYIPPGHVEAVLAIGFHITNPTKFRMTFTNVDLWLDRQLIESIHYGELFVAPDEYAIIEINHPLRGAKLTAFLNSILQFELGGEVSFVDAFGERRSQRFGFTCRARYRGGAEFERIAFKPPDEGELGNQGNKKQNPN